MSILNTSVSGMQGNSNWLSSISQNVANANTSGYKNVETDFSSLVDQISNGDADFGGVSTSQVSLNALQGNVISTATPTDLAVQGAGFFVVSDSSGAMYLTRNGSFTPDASGNLVNSAGYYLMAANVQNGASPLAANSLTDLQKVNVVNAGQTATATTTATLTANVPSTATPVAPANLPSANSASSTYTEATSLVVYGNLGASHTVNLYYTNTGSNTWEVDAFDASKASPSGGFPYSAGPLATQTLTFNPTTGALSSGSTLSLTVPNGQPMNLDLSNTTQLAAGFNVTAATANGMAPSGISGVSISTS
jgi:flagellar hook protein FlgE